MDEGYKSILGFVKEIEKRLRYAVILAVGLGALLYLDRFHRTEVDLGGFVRGTFQVIVALSLATIVVVVLNHGFLFGRKLYQDRTKRIQTERLAQQQTEAAERDRIERQLDEAFAMTYQEAEEENAERDHYEDLCKWILSLDETALRYLAAIYKDKLDEFWADPSDRAIRVLVERRYLKEFGSRDYQHGYRYVVPNPTKSVLDENSNVFKKFEVESQPWKRYRRNSWYV